MADEELAIVPSEPAEPTIATEKPETEVEKPETVLEPGEEAELEAGEEAEAPEIEYVTVERNGKQYTVPKELEGELLMQADYTKKTQAVSEKAKELEGREASIDQQLAATEDELRDRALLIQANVELDHYKKVDWEALEGSDPLAAQQHWRRYQQLQEGVRETEAALKTKQDERTQKAERDLATRVEETAKFAQKEIPGWTPAVTDKLVKFALENGVPEDTIKKNWSPTFYKLLHQAEIGAQAMKRQATAKPAPTPVAPLKTVTGKVSPAASKTLADLAAGDDLEAYAAARKAGRVR